MLELCALSTDVQSHTFHRLLDEDARTLPVAPAVSRVGAVLTLHLRSAPAALREEEANHFGGGVGASRIGVRPDWASPVPGVPATMHRPGFSDDDVVDVAVYSACARMTSGMLAIMRRR